MQSLTQFSQIMFISHDLTGILGKQRKSLLLWPLPYVKKSCHAPHMQCSKSEQCSPITLLLLPPKEDDHNNDKNGSKNYDEQENSSSWNASNYPSWQDTHSCIMGYTTKGNMLNFDCHNVVNHFESSSDYSGNQSTTLAGNTCSCNMLLCILTSFSTIWLHRMVIQNTFHVCLSTV